MKKRILLILAILLVAAGIAAGVWIIAFKKTDINKCSVTVFKNPVYTGEQAAPGISVHYKKHILKNRQDFVIRLSGDVDAGQTEAVLRGKGRYKGSVHVSYTIEPAPLASLTPPADQTYTGEAITPEASVTGCRKTLTAGTDYDIEYDHNTDVGPAIIRATGKGNFTGTLSETFAIVPASTELVKISENVPSINVTWKPQVTQTSGYQIQYAVDKAFPSGSKIVSIPDIKATSKTLDKIDPDKSHYLRIRTYKTIDDREYCSGWSEPLKADGFQPLPAETVGAVKVSKATVYSDNDTASSVVSTLPFASHVNTERKQDSWCFVSYTSDGQSRHGYMEASSLVLYNNTKKYLALTFDDGPKAGTTDIVLAALEKNKCRATFFIVGKNVNDQTAALIKKEKSLGCELGNHSFNHAQLTTLGEDDIKEQLAQTDSAVSSVAGSSPTLCRAPYGSVDDTVLALMNRPHILWSVDTLDWKYRDTEKLIETVKESKEDGAVILMHDIHASTADAIDQICADLNEEGFCAVTVTELAAINGKPLENNQTYRSFKK